MVSKIEVDEITNQSGDQDSGLDLSTNDQVKVNIANAQVMKVTGTQTDIKVSASRELNILKDSSDDFLVLKCTAPDASNNLRTIELVGETISFATGASSGTSSTERMRVSNSGDLGIGTTNPVAKLHIVGSHLQVNSETDSGSTVHHYSNTTSGGAYRVRFDSNSSVVGSIAVGSSSTAYNTSSDYRLKENVVTDWDATTRLKQLKPSRFNFIADADTTVDGFLAHEVSGIVPEATTGEKDAVDADGNIEPQCIDQSKLVPLLTKALQEAVAKIETLEARITALEGS